LSDKRGLPRIQGDWKKGRASKEHRGGERIKNERMKIYTEPSRSEEIHRIYRIKGNRK